MRLPARGSAVSTAEASGAKQQAGPKGFCQVTGRMGPIPTTHPMKLQVPGWMSMGVSLVSYDKAAFESYGLEGTANASIGYDAADGYAVALTALVQEQASGRDRLRVTGRRFALSVLDPRSGTTRLHGAIRRSRHAKTVET